MLTYKIFKSSDSTYDHMLEYFEIDKSVELTEYYKEQRMKQYYKRRILDVNNEDSEVGGFSDFLPPINYDEADVSLELSFEEV